MGLSVEQSILLLDMLLLRAIAANLAEDARYGCFCGDDPYTKGEPCPKCAAIEYLERNPVPPKSNQIMTERRGIGGTPAGGG